MTGVAVVGPGWGDPDSGRFGGRYPLAVERHTMRQVAALVPGVTTVTPHARYYTLHALVAAEASERGLAAAETVDLLRRAEVVMAAVTLAHGHHSGFPQPHGSDRIAPALRTGRVDVTALSAPNVYVQAEWGFSGPYVGSESLLGLVDTSKGSIRPGENLDTQAVRDGLGGLLDLAREDDIDIATLRTHRSLCLCGAARGKDGELLRSLMLPTKFVPSSAADHRAQTIRMLLRLLTLQPAAVPTRDLWHVLAFDPTAAQDPVLVNLEATPAWTGLVLRGQSVAAWRNLWAWLVDQIEGLMEIRALADALAQSLPDQTVREFEDALPPVTHADGRPAPAEIDPESPRVWWRLSIHGG
ncbi:hypothetical protein KMZ30_08740 [Phycicoccus sp. KQZ13P-1]|uniref:hypothetical protein n=1 Tax=Phycicoccus mangrovi TaxID=2840470 RepID=UPI001C00386F|nr:hypothetical protein [Phycicoccus mangrovi]MBT9255663.1 hypothetical protein [Phycicoccus mangrovi]